jgi:hypothetical protein
MGHERCLPPQHEAQRRRGQRKGTRVRGRRLAWKKRFSLWSELAPTTSITPAATPAIPPLIESCRRVARLERVTDHRRRPEGVAVLGREQEEVRQGRYPDHHSPPLPLRLDRTMTFRNEFSRFSSETCSPRMFTALLSRCGVGLTESRWQGGSLGTSHESTVDDSGAPARVRVGAQPPRRSAWR